MDNNNDNNQIQNAKPKIKNENEMKNLEKKEPNTFEIKVHKSILSSRSPFFNEFLRDRDQINKIFLNQFNKKEMESILSYIYYGNISFDNQENLIQLLEISIYFKLNLLKEIIQKKISNSINYSNFFQFLFQNRNLNSNEIEIKCFELINQNFSQIQNNENLFNLTKEEIIKFIQFKQEKKEIFQFDFFQFLDNWIEKRIRKKKIQAKIKENDKKIKLFESENQNLKQENQKKEIEIEKKDKILKQKDEEIQNLKLSFEKEIEKEKQKIKENQKEESNQNENQNQIQIQNENENQNQNQNQNQNENENENENQNQNQNQNENENENENQNQNKLLKIFSDSEIITENEYAKKLQEWINNNDFFSKMKKGFSAKRDGFNSKNWHKAVDGKGKTLVIIKTKDNFIFGGFTQVGFNGNKGRINDSNAFIFSLRNDKGDRKPEKFTIKQGKEGNAIYYNLSYGPIFGCKYKSYFYLINIYYYN
ncbi:pep-cterm sorting domain-containing protein [Anaeramoeba ignava]|uniref:Pep-cterm sorting domain-containing protein n=1 Tax=Anaeramoeba ignava TaxID=1746090 RepID=A0A9Q0LCA2_ANAIG|nr:pep-cterm sorting domain-containing protein [Anaeramoeba ignava]